MSKKVTFNVNTKIQNDLILFRNSKQSIKKRIIIGISIFIILFFGLYLYTQSEILVPNSAKKLNSKSYIEVVDDFKKAGFYNITLSPVDKSLLNVFKTFEDVEHIEINGKSQFSAKDKFKRSSHILIYYYSRD